jgi:hypothetical protein
MPFQLSNLFSLEIVDVDGGVFWASCNILVIEEVYA